LPLGISNRAKSAAKNMYVEMQPTVMAVMPSWNTAPKPPKLYVQPGKTLRHITRISYRCNAIPTMFVQAEKFLPARDEHLTLERKNP